MSFGIVATVGAAVAGGAMAASGAKGAAKTQAASADRATDAQREMFERQVELQQPFRDFGGAGVNRLAYEMGLSPTGFYGPGGKPMSSGPTETEAQIRERLRGHFQTGAQEAKPNWYWGGDGEGGGWLLGPEQQATPASFDNAGYESAVQAELARMQQAQAAQAATTQSALTDPNYGGLLRDFSKADFEVDPGYQFRQEEGEKAMQRAASAQGGIGSGKFLKDAMRFNQGIATEEYGKSFDRFNINKTNRFNRLASVAGIGQTAANQTGAAAATFGSQMGSNIIGAGNARAAGQVGSANAWGNALGQGASMYQQNQLMQSLQQPAPYGYTVPNYPGAEY